MGWIWMAVLLLWTKPSLNKVQVEIMIVIDPMTVTEIEVVIAVAVIVNMEVGGDLGVESALSVANQDTLLENALVKEVRGVGMVAEMIGMAAATEVVVLEVVAIMDLKEMETALETAAAGMAVDMGEVNDIAVIVQGHTIVGVLALALVNALRCTEELGTNQAGYVEGLKMASCFLGL